MPLSPADVIELELRSMYFKQLQACSESSLFDPSSPNMLFAFYSVVYLDRA
jgi:hypothetical protein